MTFSLIAIAVLLWIVASAAALAAAFRHEIAAAWRGPALSRPVLIIESDDWGYGPPEQAAALRAIAARLGRHRDSEGHPAVMTLGVILAGPDTARIASAPAGSYHRLLLNDARLEAVRAAMLEGARQGTFALQLHGMEHFLPAVVLETAARDPEVASWLTGQGVAKTESLPARLQSRWVDAGELPSRALSASVIHAAVREEVAAFEQVFDAAPEVVVPPTFVWTQEVERAWAEAGLRVLVTPGRRYEGRDAAGRPDGAAKRFHNGERGSSGLLRLVRDDYFEPASGHSAERALAAVGHKLRLGRPALLETHRANFIGDAATADRSLDELDRLLSTALERWQGLRFMSSAALAAQYRDRGSLLEHRFLPRLHCAILRLREVSRLRKLAWLSGIAFPAALLWMFTQGSRAPKPPD